MSLFLMLAFYLFIKFTANGKLLTLAFLALTIGYLPQIRPTFLPFSILVLAIIGFRLFNKIVQAKKMIFYMILCVMLFFLPFTYNLIGNFRYHGIWTPFLIDNLLVENLYVSLYLERFFFSEKYFPLPAEVDWIYGLYSAPKKSNEERKKMTEMFLTLSKQKILEDPITFVKIRFKKMWYVWEKHFVLAYQGVGNKWVIGTTYLLNLMLLITGLSGYISEARKKFVVEDERRLFFMLTAVFFVYLTVISSLTSAEERYTIPAYPLVFVFSGSGIYFFLRKIKGYKNGKK